MEGKTNTFGVICLSHFNLSAWFEIECPHYLFGLICSISITVIGEMAAGGCKPLGAYEREA